MPGLHALPARHEFADVQIEPPQEGAARNLGLKLRSDVVLFRPSAAMRTTPGQRHVDDLVGAHSRKPAEGLGAVVFSQFAAGLIGMRLGRFLWRTAPPAAWRHGRVVRGASPVPRGGTQAAPPGPRARRSAPQAPQRDVPTPRNADIVLFPTAPPSETNIGKNQLRKSQGMAVNSYLSSCRRLPSPDAALVTSKCLTDNRRPEISSRGLGLDPVVLCRSRPGSSR